MDVLLLAARKFKGDEDELQEDEDPDEEVRDAPGVSRKAVRRDTP